VWKRVPTVGFVSETVGALPARFAWLTGTIAIIFSREAATFAAALASTPWAVTIAVAISVKPTTASAAATAAPWAARAAASARATAAGCGLWARLIHFQRSPANFLAIQSLHGLCGFRIVGHLDECESPCSSGFPVHCDVNPCYLSERFEERAQLRFRRLEIHVPDKHVLHKFLSFKEWESAKRAASMAEFRSHRGENEGRMRSRKVINANTPEEEDNPRLPYKTQQLYQRLAAFP